MRLIQKKIKMAVAAVVILLLTVVPAVYVQAATGKTTIAVSSDEIDVGDTVTITVKAKTESGGNAKAKIKLNYDDEILEFVSCSETYDGGAGGSVTATAKSMTVKFKAIEAGKCPLSVEASNGVDSGSGNSLSSVEGCSTNITVKEGSNGNSSSGRLSADNSLKSLTLSAGTLSPEFAGNVVNYTATVPGDVTSVEVNAETANASATIEAVAGNTDLQVGLNTIKVVVKAESGALATYTIELTREEEEEVVSTETENITTEVVEDTTSKELEEALEHNQYLENSYNQLEEKYQREKDFSRSVIYVLIFIIAILLVVIINIVVYYRRKMDEDFDDSFEEKKTVKKKEPQRPVSKPVEIKKEGPKKVEPEIKKTAPKVEKTSTKVEKTSTKVEVGKNFEVFDFNDED